ncbi:AGAP011406-PA, partial [Anopheles gambiae str. PEST]
CLNLQINDDNKATFSVCMECTSKLKVASTFRNTCLKNDPLFRDLYQVLVASGKERLQKVVARIELSDTDDGMDDEDAQTKPVVIYLNDPLWKPSKQSVPEVAPEPKLPKRSMFINWGDSLNPPYPEVRELGKKKKKRYLCDICGISMSCILRHYDNHSEEQIHSCPHCPVKMKQKSNIAQHILTVHLKQNTRKCAICGKGFIHHKTYRYHMYVRERGKRKKHLCEICGVIVFHMPSHYEKHREPSFECSLCPYDRRKVLCHLCGKTVADISVHLVSHKQEANHQCPHCPTKMTHPSNLLRHVESVHMKKIIKTCALCGEGGVLKRHATVHSTDTPYHCKHCPKQFKSGEAKKAHELTHSGVKFDCKFCNKSYRYRTQLCTHVTRTHRIKVEENASGSD